MKKGRTYKPETMKMIPAIFIGVAAFVVLIMVFGAVAAFLLNVETVPVSAIEPIAIVALLVSSMVGCLISVMLHKSQYALIAGITVGVIVILLLCTNFLLLDGVFNNVLIKITMIIAGGALSCIIGLKTDGSNRRKKYRSR